MELKSKTATVNKPANELFKFLCDVKNFEVLMPENISKFEVIRENAFVFGLNGMPEIALEIKEVVEPNKIILGAISDKIPFTLITNISEVDANTSEAEFHFEGTFNTMMAMMIKGPIKKFIGTLADNMETL